MKVEMYPPFYCPSLASLESRKCQVRYEHSAYKKKRVNTKLCIHDEKKGRVFEHVERLQYIV